MGNVTDDYRTKQIPIIVDLIITRILHQFTDVERFSDQVDIGLLNCLYGIFRRNRKEDWSEEARNIILPNIDNYINTFGITISVNLLFSVLGRASCKGTAILFQALENRDAEKIDELHDKLKYSESDAVICMFDRHGKFYDFVQTPKNSQWFMDVEHSIGPKNVLVAEHDSIAWLRR